MVVHPETLGVIITLNPVGLPGFTMAPPSVTMTIQVENIKTAGSAIPLS